MGCDFESHAHRGAILHLKHFAMSEKCVNEKISDHLENHYAKIWRPYLKNFKPPKTVMVVTGFVKSADWAVTAFEANSVDVDTHLKVGISFVNGKFAFTAHNDHGVHRSHLSGPHTPSRDHTMNQTIFINVVEIEPRAGIQSVSQSSFRKTLKSISRPFRIRGGTGPTDDPTEDDQGSNQDLPEMYNEDVSTTLQNTSDVLSSLQDDLPHFPCAILRRYILEVRSSNARENPIHCTYKALVQSSEAVFAIASDSELELLLVSV